MLVVPQTIRHVFEGTSARRASCWKITRSDDVVLRFTDHDRELVVDGETYAAFGGGSASARQERNGLNDNDAALVGYFDDDSITDSDLRLGRYDNALVEERVVDWKYPFLGSPIVASYEIVQVTFSSDRWEARVANVTHRLEQRVGQTYEKGCEHTFGDPDTCGFDLSTIEETGSIVSVLIDRVRFETSSTAAEADHFLDGMIRFTSGAANGLELEIKRSTAAGVVELYVESSATIAAGDAYVIRPGCAHTREACKAYGRILDYGGYPDVQGTDKYAVTPDTPIS